MALEALHLNRPVLGTPTGGPSEICAQPGAGWLSAGTSPGDLADAIEALLADPEAVTDAIAGGGAAAAARALTSRDEILSAYAELIESGPHRAPPAQRMAAEAAASAAAPAEAAPAPAAGVPAAGPPLVTAVLPYLGEPGFADTLASTLAQTHRPLEVIVVADGVLPPEGLDDERVLLLGQEQRGAGAARNAGILQARGRYVALALAGADPSLVARCAERLDRDPDVAYVTAGGTIAMLRRELFERGFAYDEELTAHEDRLLRIQLDAAGLRGDALDGATPPAREPDARLAGEIAARLREREVRWTTTA